MNFLSPFLFLFLFFFVFFVCVCVSQYMIFGRILPCTCIFLLFSSEKLFSPFRIRERKESVTVLLCGTSGCGKSTLSALLVIHSFLLEILMFFSAT